MFNYRRLHEEQLRENRPAFYRDLKRSGELEAHLDHISETAKAQHALIVQQLAERNPYNPVEWKNDRAAWEGWLKRTAHELVLHGLILVPDEETERAEREGGYTD